MQNYSLRICEPFTHHRQPQRESSELKKLRRYLHLDLSLPLSSLPQENPPQRLCYLLHKISAVVCASASVCWSLSPILSAGHCIKRVCYWLQEPAGPPACCPGELSSDLDAALCGPFSQQSQDQELFTLFPMNLTCWLLCLARRKYLFLLVTALDCEWWW